MYFSQWNNKRDIARSSDEAKNLLIQQCSATDEDKELIRQEVDGTLIHFILTKLHIELWDFVDRKYQERGITNE